jgi:hypothetical protein
VKQKTKVSILITVVMIFLITIGYKKMKAASPGSIRHCFTCDTVPEGAVLCDDFESETPLITGIYFRRCAT